jgi:hypothetical protein
LRFDPLDKPQRESVAAAFGDIEIEIIEIVPSFG